MRHQLLAATSTAILILASHALTSDARAQTIDYGALEQLFGEPVTTSATGSPQKATEVPATMEIVTAEDIRRSGARDIPGVLKHVTGVDVLQWGTDSADVGVRGYDQAYSPRLLVLIDGRQVYADYYGFTPWSAIPVELGAIRQIEVVKGPNSALFGFNAVGGVINIVTYNPLYDDVNTATLLGGTQGLAQGSAVGTVKLGSIGGLRISAGGRSGDDFSSPLPASSLGARRGNNRGAIDVDGVFRLSDKVQLTLEASHTEADQTEFTPGFTYGYNRYGTDSVKGQINADTAFGALQGSVYSNWIKATSFTGTSTIPFLTINNQVTVAQAQDTFKLGSDHTFRATAEYRHNSMGTVPTGGSHIFYDVMSGGGMWDWKILPTLSLTNALRLDYLSLGKDGTKPAGFPLNNSYWNRTITEPSFNSGLVWQADDVDTFRLTAARGVQVPNLLQLGGILIGAGKVFNSGLPTLDPTIVMNYELGWDRAVPALGGQTRVNVFHQTNDAVSSLFGGLSRVNGVLISSGANIGSSEANGMEFSVKGTFLQDWRWGASYTPEIVTDRFTVSSSVSGVDYQHTTPTHIIKANLGWAHGPWEIDSYLQYTSSFYGIVLAPGATTGGATQLSRINDYVSLDLRVAYKLTDWATIALSAQNFSQASQRQTVGANVGRVVYGSLTFNF
ncbi:MAG TPA: TonB-dependent receptor [Stellaceae bacterium]|nr:TonB-dependent receptor [Stellaceae bacterium]